MITHVPITSFSDGEVEGDNTQRRARPTPFEKANQSFTYVVRSSVLKGSRVQYYTSFVSHIPVVSGLARKDSCWSCTQCPEYGGHPQTGRALFYVKLLPSSKPRKFVAKVVLEYSEHIEHSKRTFSGGMPNSRDMKAWRII